MKEQLACQTFTSMNDGILEIVVTGKITELDIPRLQKEFSSHRIAGRHRMLIDVRALNESADIGMLYHVRRPERAIGKTAILDISENEQFKSLWENLTKYTPMELKWFSNIDAARDWLKCSERNRTMFMERLFSNVKNQKPDSNPQL